MNIDSVEKNLGSEGREEKPLWFDQASQKWSEIDSHERQDWLAKVAEDYGLGGRESFLLLAKHKEVDFNRIPEEYQKALAIKWGFVDFAK